MADIPTNRITVFPATTRIIEDSPVAGTTRVESIIEIAGVTLTDGIANMPTRGIADPERELIGLTVPAEVLAQAQKVLVEASGFPEQIYIDGTIAAGKEVVINAGVRVTKLNEAQFALGNKQFQGNLAGDVLFADVAAGGKLTFNADTVQGNTFSTALINPATGKQVQYPQGGNDVGIISGQGDITLKLGKEGNHAFVSAKTSNITTGPDSIIQIDGQNLAGQNHTVKLTPPVVGTPVKRSIIQPNFDGVKPVGTITFDALVGATEQNNTDQAQLIGLPVGAKVKVEVSAIRGGGTFPDADMKLTVTKADGTALGVINMTNANYAFANGQAISPKSIGAGGSRTYTVTDAVLRALDAQSPKNLPKPEYIAKPELFL